MKWLKICALVVITLAVMRGSSWALAWALTRIVAARARTIAIVSNIAAFTVFLLLLYVNLVPGEPMDFAAVFFGFAVFALYTAWDFFWSPWKRRF